MSLFMPSPSTPILVLVMILSLCYALLLEWLERVLPIHPDYIWLEVVGGVAIMLGPPLAWYPAIRITSADEMRDLIIRCVFAAALPVISWQVVLWIGGRDRLRNPPRAK